MSKQRSDSSGGNSKIFISYRREDSSGHAGRLCADLERHFGAERVFMDVLGIGAGEDFVRVIEEKLASSEVLIAVIGRQWLNPPADETSRQQDAPGDWVYLEIATALEKRMRVIPVLVHGASMPDAQDLPHELKPLARQQALEIRDNRWDFDVAGLIRILEREVPKRNFNALIILAALALIGMLSLLYYLATVQFPARKLDLPPIMRGEDELIITGPVINKTGLLLSRVAQPDEDIEVELQNARLFQQTVNDFGLDARSSSTLQRIRYSSDAGDKPEPASNKCTTSIQIRLQEDGKRPDAIHFSQKIGSPGGSDFRDLEMKSVGADLVIDLRTNPLSNAKVGSFDTGPGCGKRLETNFDPEPHLMSGQYVVAGVVTAGSLFRFRFMSAPTSKRLWENEEGTLEPFALGSPPLDDDPVPFLQARAVSIKSVKGDTIFEIQSVDERSLLRIDSLKIGSQQLQMSVSGERRVGLKERIRMYPVTAGLLSIVTIALIVWLALLVRRFLRSRR